MQCGFIILRVSNNHQLFSMLLQCFYALIWWQVGNKADLERSRVLQTSEGCDLAVEFGAKFTETSPGMGHHIDELLVGIVMQMR